ncbi:MAG: gluconate 2-dehydrogenase subunit 3 family protein [Tannerellaceae bacterium]|jgi:gluconate 2-dehydrogenase gamma chain|nr:gluconate 2-dehydrogenase subunit 3 family protein [Tannerellaceae bacterium]
MPQQSPYRIFSPEEAGCLIALCEQIIPADDAPGATEAGVIYYIDATVARYFPDTKDRYHNGIASLQAHCQAAHGQSFEALSPTLRTEVVERMETGSLPPEHWETISPQAFLTMVIRHTMQGFYGPPRHGGNRNYASYRMLKLDFPLVVGQNRYSHG